MSDVKIVSKTTGLLAADIEFIQGNEVLLIGRNDRTIAIVSSTGEIKQIGVGMNIDDQVQTNFNAGITDYPRGYNSIRRVSQSTANAAGAPGSTDSGGVLSTFRMLDDNFSWQEWRRSIETTIYRRYWITSSNSWSAFA